MHSHTLGSQDNTHIASTCAKAKAPCVLEDSQQGASRHPEDIREDGILRNQREVEDNPCSQRAESQPIFLKEIPRHPGFGDMRPTC